MGLASESDTIESWRVRLSRGLILLTAGLTPLVAFPAIAGLQDNRIRLTIGFVCLGIVLAMLALYRANWGFRIRAIGVIAAFSVIGITGFSTLGFVSAPGIAFAAAVAFSGLLLGQRAMLITATLLAVTSIAIAVLMTNGMLQAPRMVEISPALPRPWIRSLGISFLLILILGAVVTWVVQQMEQILDRVARESKLRRDAEVQVQQAQRTELIGQLAASVAHDVNNHLTVIASCSSLIASVNTNPEFADLGKAMEQSIENASTLTRKLLMLARRDTVTPEQIGLRTFLLDNERILRTLLTPTISLTMHADADAWCEIDKAQLNQILLNLVVNANDAMAGAGTLDIRIESRHGAEGIGLAGAIPVGNWAVLAVQDSGTGMSAEVQKSAFEPFFTTKGIGKGTGLGLATIAAIVAQAGGHVVLDTEIGRGTCVEVWLRLTAAQSSIHEDLAPQASLNELRILVVDDTPGVLAAARRSLVDAGANVETAVDGDDALRCIAAGAFDVLCSDVEMPGASVMDVVNAFRIANTDARILLMSGYVDDKSLRKSIEHKDYAFLAKPYTPSELIRAIHSVAPTPIPRISSAQG